MVWNLVSNAVKFTHAGGRVVISAQREPERLILRVRDTGQGLAPEAVSRVFERFWQADSSATRRHGGLGLGLSIVRYLVELHGGTVHAESDGVGLGACFSVELPTTKPSLDVSPLPERERTSSIPNTRPLAGMRVLLVEDDEDSREIVALVLKQCGADVCSADSADSALAQLSADPPTIIISDIGMPGTDGYAFLRIVRTLPAEHGRDIPAIALTAFTRELDRVEAAAAGFQGHVAKPVIPAVLVSAIQHAVGRG